MSNWESFKESVRINYNKFKDKIIEIKKGMVGGAIEHQAQSGGRKIRKFHTKRTSSKSLSHKHTKRVNKTSKRHKHT